MKAFASLALAFALATMSAASGAEETPAGAEDPVLAVVNGTEVRRSEVVESAKSLPPEYQASSIRSCRRWWSAMSI